MYSLRWSYLRTHIFWRKLKKILKIGLVMIIVFFFLLMFLASGDQKCPEEGCGKTGAFINILGKRQIRTDSNVKRILRWTGFFTDLSWEQTDDSYFKPCKVNKCTLTNDRSMLDKSDAVLFHVGAVWNFWRGTSMPDRRHPFQYWVLYNIEPPPRVPLNLRKYNGVFNWTAWYRRDSDVPVSYGGYTKYPLPPSLKFNKSMMPNWSRENNRFSAWMASNCYDYNRRQILIEELKNLVGKDLDLYGKCGTRPCPETICFDTISNYKFFFTFENSNCKNYITEKFWTALLRRQVPVVFGGASREDYSKIAPSHSFIHVNDFKDTRSLVDYLRYLAKNETAYNEYLKWTTEVDVYGEVPARRKWWCDLCEALHDKSRPAQIYADIDGWFQNDVCPQWTLSNQISRLVDGIKIKIGLL